MSLALTQSFAKGEQALREALDHAARRGVIVIPAHLADEIANETFEMTAFEDFVTEEVRKGRGIFGLYPPTDEQTLKDFAAWLKKTGR